MMRCVAVVLFLLSVGCESEPLEGIVPDESARNSVPAQTQLPPDAPESVSSAIEEPSIDKPVVLSAVLNPGSVNAGEFATLVVQGKIAKRWHIYAVDGLPALSQPTRLKLTLPDGVGLAGDWTLPAADIISSPTGPAFVYHDDVRFSVPLKVEQEAPAAASEIQCEIRYQACDDSRCLPPTSVKLVVPLTIVSRKGS